MAAVATSLTIAVFIADLTVENGASNRQYLFTVKKAIEDINTQQIIKGGLKVNFEYYNTNREKITAASLAIDAIAAGNRSTSPLIGIIGETYSGVSESINIIASHYNIIQCGGISTSDTLSDKKVAPSFYRTCPQDSFQVGAFAGFIKKMGWSKVAIISESSSYGQGLKTSFTDLAAGLGIQVLGSFQFIEGQSQSSWAPISKDVQNCGARIILFFGYDKDVLPFFSEADKLGMMSNEYFYIGSDGVFTLTPDQVGNDPYNQNLIENLYAINPLSYEDNNVWKNLDTAFQTPYPGSRAPGQFYDCAFSIAHAVNAYTARTGEAVTVYGKKGRITLGDVGNVKFKGATGDFGINITTGNPKTSAYEVVRFSKTGLASREAVIQAHLKHDDLKYLVQTNAKYTFRGGLTSPPDDSVGELKILYTESGPIIMLIVFGILLLTMIFSFFYLIAKRRQSLVRSLSLPILLYILCGLAIGSTSILGYIGELNDFVCGFQQWGLWIAFTIVFSNLFFKVFRIWRIFDQIVIGKRIFLLNSSLMMFSTALVLVDVIILAIWTILDPMKPVLKKSALTYYNQCESQSSKIFSHILMAYNALILLGVLVLAFKTRNVANEYRESSWITQLSINTCLCSGITIAIIYILDDPLTKFYVRMVTVAFGISVIYFCLVGRVILQVMFSKTPSTIGSIDSQIISDATPCRGNTSKLDTRRDSAILNPKELELFVGTLVIKNLGSIFSVWTKANVIVTGKNLMLYVLSADMIDRSPMDNGLCLDLSLAVLQDPEPESLNLKVLGTGAYYEFQTKSRLEKRKLIASIGHQRPTIRPKKNNLNFVSVSDF